MDLICPAGNLPALKAAVENGASAVYMGFRDDTNARHFAGLNFNEERAREAVEFAHSRGTKVYLAVNTYAQTGGWRRWTAAVDSAAELGFDALILADIGVLGYAAERHPQLALHLSVQASATNRETLRFFHQQFGIRRAVLPRVLSLAQVRMLAENTPVEIEVFGFGSLCIMAEGRCTLSSYVTGESPNSYGVCSPAKAVRWETTSAGLESRLNGVLIDRFGNDENAGYPTLCKGRFNVEGQTYHALEEPTSLNTLELLPQLMAIGVKAIKIEGRQRSPAYVERVTRVWRQAIDACARSGEQFQPREDWQEALAAVSEGSQTTLGAYHRPWQ
jgi:O2-independent ubiquinone biosynthesis protein UbiU